MPGRTESTNVVPSMPSNWPELHAACTRGLARRTLASTRSHRRRTSSGTDAATPNRSNGGGALTVGAWSTESSLATDSEEAARLPRLSRGCATAGVPGRGGGAAARPFARAGGAGLDAALTLGAAATVAADAVHASTAASSSGSGGITLTRALKSMAANRRMVWSSWGSSQPAPSGFPWARAANTARR